MKRHVFLGYKSDTCTLALRVSAQAAASQIVSDVQCCYTSGCNAPALGFANASVNVTLLNPIKCFVGLDGSVQLQPVTRKEYHIVKNSGLVDLICFYCILNRHLVEMDWL